MSSVYLHLPYCLYKCHYCDFNSYATKLAQIPFEKYEKAILNEFEWRIQTESAVSQHFDTPIQTIFLGGGTPSLFPAKVLRRILDRLTCQKVDPIKRSHWHGKSKGQPQNKPWTHEMRQAVGNQPNQLAAASAEGIPFTEQTAFERQRCCSKAQCRRPQSGTRKQS